jgi:hypothetical protein
MRLSTMSCWPTDMSWLALGINSPSRFGINLLALSSGGRGAVCPLLFSNEQERWDFDRSEMD